jgi:predicted nucleic-acid-binding protein
LTAAALCTVVEGLLNHQSLTLQDGDVVQAALDLFQEQPRLGFSDCLMLQVAAKAGHRPLGTFDRDLSKLPGTHRL